MIKEKSKKIHKAKVARIEKVSANSYLIEIEGEISQEIKAGQFISIYCENLTFRRPFSVFSHNSGKIGILFKERGKGTKYIKSLKKDDLIDITGVFGNGFNVENKKSLLIGAGIGAAPISFLKSKLNEKNIENLFIAGFLNKNEIPSCIKADIAYTDDGSYGRKGSVITDIENIIKDYKPEIIYVCGPEIVLKTLSRIGEKYNIETQIAVEKVMACSIGVCRGCVISVRKDGNIVNAAVCKDGPVFSGSEVVWQ